MQRPRKIEDMKKIRTGTREVFGREVGNSVWANGSGIEEVVGTCRKFTGGKMRVERRLRLFWARGLAELRQLASGYATPSDSR